MLPDKIAFVDTETTGGSLRRDRVIEIGIVRIENNQIVKTFSSLINPQVYLPEEITQLTGITRSELEAAPIFFDIQEQIKELLDDCIMVAHNVRFDFSFLQNEFRIIGQNFSPKHFCTVKLSRALFPEHRHHNLDSIIERFGFKCKRRHRALDDAQILWDFYQKVSAQFEPEILLQAVQKAMKRPTIPIKISQEQLDAIPDSPGVYIFYGENGMPLYIGKSISLRKRVLSHFSSDHLSSTEMKIAQQVEQIEIITTAGEMGALFKESLLIKQMQPLYNRKLRLSRKLLVLKRILDDEGYFTLSLEMATKIESDEIKDVISVFKSKKQTKNLLINLCKEYDLCEKLLGLEKTKSGCFGYRLGRCKGACLNKEDTTSYNLRLEQAFAGMKLKQWPFNGAIVITEQDEFENEGEGYIFDKWCYLGKLKFEDELVNTNLEDDILFDLDTYKILAQFLKNPKNKFKIKVMGPKNLNTGLFNKYSLV